jgi:hypothetical protein
MNPRAMYQFETIVNFLERYREASLFGWFEAAIEEDSEFVTVVDTLDEFENPVTKRLADRISHVLDVFEYEDDPHYISRGDGNPVVTQQTRKAIYAVYNFIRQNERTLYLLLSDYFGRELV